jgi:hypothetical protein
MRNVPLADDSGGHKDGKGSSNGERSTNRVGIARDSHPTLHRVLSQVDRTRFRN